jgi:abhydrolase domain-containing protein 17
MKWANIMYPAPESSYRPNNEGLDSGVLLFIKKQAKETFSSEEKDKFIPTLLIRYDGRFGGSSKVLLFFHGNAEDVGLAEDLLLHLSESLEVHIIAVEYPGYGIYRDESTDPNKIEEDALCVYEYLTEDFGIKEQDIILFGRSLGSAPASYLAAKKNPGMLVLMSPFTSIKDAAGSLIGKWVKFAVSDMHRNKDHMENVDCPVYILHGEQDTLIPYSHSEELASR